MRIIVYYNYTTGWHWTYQLGVDATRFETYNRTINFSILNYIFQMQSNFIYNFLLYNIQIIIFKLDYYHSML